MRAIVFAGPSLPPSARPSTPDFVWAPPLRQGDLYRAALRRPALIGVLDGYFEIVPTVWHKEILWALAQGIHVYGAASIGALRAAELAEFGMQGVGVVFDQYRTGVLVDDDEVALTHGPEEIDYVPVSEAMVNVRATVARALALGVLQPGPAEVVQDAAKSLFYKERTWDTVLAAAAERGVRGEALGRLRGWLSKGQVDQKRLDALAMVAAMRAHLEGGVEPLRVGFEMAPTFAWEEACARIPVRD